jgi:predicted porin
MGAGLLRATYGKRDAAGIEFRNVIALGTNNPYTPSNSTSNVSVWKTLAAVGYDYNLSKRTSVYGAFARNKTQANKSFTTYQMGVAHNF